MKKSLFALSVAVAVAIPGVCQAARDTQLFFDFHRVEREALADGALDGTVRFYLKGEHVPGKIVQRFSEAVSNKKSGNAGTTGAGKGPDEGRCDWALRSVLISFQDNAKRNGANAVVDMVSYYNRIVYQDPKQYECHAGRMMVGVAMRGAAAIVK